MFRKRISGGGRTGVTRVETAGPGSGGMASGHAVYSLKASGGRTKPVRGMMARVASVMAGSWPGHGERPCGPRPRWSWRRGIAGSAPPGWRRQPKGNDGGGPADLTTQLSSEWNAPDGRVIVEDTLRVQQARYVNYDQLLENASQAYSDYMQHRKTVDRLGKIIRDIEEYAGPKE